MKRFIAAFITAALMAASMPVMAQNGINQADYETYIDRVRVCFDLPEDLPDVKINQYDKNVEISWRSEDGEHNYSASLDEHGCIKRFYSYSQKDESEDAQKLTKQQAIDKAEALLKAVYGDKAASFERVNLGIDAGSVRMYYRYTQNGIPVDAGVSISVDRVGGNIQNFSGLCDKVLGYTYVKPETIKLLTADEIYQNYKNSENIGLYYNIFYDYESDKKTVKPVYIIRPKNINASTGEEITALSEDDYIEAEEATADADNGMGAAGSAAKRVTEFERKAIKEFENLISKETADANVKKFFPQIKGYTLQSSNINTYGDHPSISLSYSGRDKNERYANAELNAQTGEILSFGNYKYNDGQKRPDIKRVENVADELFKNVAPEIYNSKDYIKKSDADSASVEYQRTHDGIKVNDQGVTISCNDDLTISRYNKNWDELDFPSVKNAVAERTVFENSKDEGFGLKYIITDNAAVLSYGYMSGGGYYRCWRGESYYDALTGEKINPYTGTPQIDNEYGEYTDLEGSPYKQVIETLAEYGYVLPYKEFKPNELITIEDFYSFINMDIIYTNNKRYYGSSTALYSEEEAKQPLKKYDIAKIFVNESGYTELAQKDIFKTEFTDVSAENTGVVAIASAMGFIPEKGGEFNGGKQITRGEAAEYLYKCLQANNAL